MKSLPAADLAVIRAVLLVSGVPVLEHQAHIEADFYSHHRVKRAMAHYRAIFGSLSRKELVNV